MRCLDFIITEDFAHFYAILTDKPMDGFGILLILVILNGLKGQNYKTDETTSKICQNRK